MAYSITIGSVLSPIGNPQNLLIAVQGGLPSPFFTFFEHLAIPTVINLVIAYAYIYFIFRKQLQQTLIKPSPTINLNQRTIFLLKLSFFIMLLLLCLKIITDYALPIIHIHFAAIVLFAALPLLFSSKRWLYFKKLDWGTLIFFISIFILMRSVWDSGFLQMQIQHNHLDITQTPIIFTVSIILSQFISNVPLVTLYLPLLIQHAASLKSLMVLAAGSTIAGNLSILGVK